MVPQQNTQIRAADGGASADAAAAERRDSRIADPRIGVSTAGPAVNSRQGSPYTDLLDRLAEAGYDDLNLRPLSPAELKLAAAAHPSALDDALTTAVIDQAPLRELIGHPNNFAALIGVAVYRQYIASLENRVGLDLFAREEDQELAGTAEAESKLDAERAEAV